MTPATEHRDSSERGPAFWVALVVGGAMIAFGVRELLESTPQTDRRVSFALWLVGADLVHDGLIAPLLCGIATLLVLAIARRLRAPVQAGLIATGAVLLVAAAPLADTASVTDNPTIQPLDYTTATLTVLGVVWGLVVVWLVVAAVRARRTTRSTT